MNDCQQIQFSGKVSPSPNFKRRFVEPNETSSASLMAHCQKPQKILVTGKWPVRKGRKVLNVFKSAVLIHELQEVNRAGNTNSGVAILQKIFEKNGSIKKSAIPPFLSVPALSVWRYAGDICVEIYGRFNSQQQLLQNTCLGYLVALQLGRTIYRKKYYLRMVGQDISNAAIDFFRNAIENKVFIFRDVGWALLSVETWSTEARSCRTLRLQEEMI